MKLTRNVCSNTVLSLVDPYHTLVISVWRRSLAAYPREFDPSPLFVS